MANVRVGVVMGSDSDLPAMKETAKVLEDFGVAYDITVMSVHRTPMLVHKYAADAAEKGYEVIIAGAGGAAHLAGTLAALTIVPVIGVPMMTQGLGGVDSLYSIVQMPGGVPVATVGIGKSGAKNAGILAVQILAGSDDSLKSKLGEHKKKLEREAHEKAARVQAEMSGG